MHKRLFLSILLAVSFVAANAARASAQAGASAQNGTLVMQSGDRVQALVVNIDNANVRARVNGRLQSIPTDEVAFIDFVRDGRNMSADEVERADRAGDEGLVVLRNGQTFIGRPAGLRPYTDRLQFSSGVGGRNVSLGQIARLYLGSGFGDSGGYERFFYNDRYGYGNNGPGNYGYGQRGDDYGYGGIRTQALTIPSNQNWTDTGISVLSGQRIHFRAQGDVRLSLNGNDYGSPAGAFSGRMAGNSPLRGVTAGTLIGRVDNGRPFIVGTETDIVMPRNGRLYLGINDDDVRDNEGGFDVQISQR